MNVIRTFPIQPQNVHRCDFLAATTIKLKNCSNNISIEEVQVMVDRFLAGDMGRISAPALKEMQSTKRYFGVYHLRTGELVRIHSFRAQIVVEPY
jgi:hypothetical protein